MPNLATCLSRIDMPEPMKQVLLAAADEYVQRGYSGREADLGAVQDWVHDLEQYRADIIRQITPANQEPGRRRVTPRELALAGGRFDPDAGLSTQSEVPSAADEAALTRAATTRQPTEQEVRLEEIREFIGEDAAMSFADGGFESLSPEQQEQITALLGRRAGDTEFHTESGQNLPIRETIQLKTRNPNTLTKARDAVLAVLKALNGGEEIADDAVRITSQGLELNVELPPAIARDPDVAPAMVKALVRAAADGAADNRKTTRLTLERDSRSPKHRTAKQSFHIPHLVTVGQTLIGRTRDELRETPVEARDALLAAIGWLHGQGWVAPDTGITIDEKASILTRSGLTWKQVGSAVRKTNGANADPIAAMTHQQALQYEQMLLDALGQLGSNPVPIRTSDTARGEWVQRGDDARISKSYETLSLFTQLGMVQKRIAELETEQFRNTQQARPETFVESRYIGRDETGAPLSQRVATSRGNPLPQGIDETQLVSGDTSEVDSTDNTGGGFSLDTERNQMLRARGESMERGDLPVPPFRDPDRAQTLYDEGILPDASLDTQASVVQGSESKELEGEASAVARILKAVGIELRSPIALADAAGIRALGQRLKDPHNKELLRQVLRDKPSARVVFLRGENRVFPLIYMGDGFKSKTARAHALIHEVGHIVLRHTMNTTPDEVIGALHEVLGGNDYTTFEENFANYFTKWHDRAAIDSAFSAASPELRSVVKKFFRGLWQTLRNLWNKARGELEINQSFRQFMEALVARKTPEKLDTMQYGNQYAKWVLESGVVQTGFLKPTPYAAEYLDFTPVPEGARRAAQRIVADRKVQHVMEAGKNTGKTLLAFHDRYVRSFNSWLEHHNMGWLAQKFQPKAGSRAARNGASVFLEIRYWYGQFVGDRKRGVGGLIERHAPKVSFLDAIRNRNPELTPVQAEARDILLNERDPGDNPIAKEWAKIRDDLFKFLRDAHIPIARRKNFFPVLYSQSKLRELGMEEFVSTMRGWAETYPTEAKAFFDNIERIRLLSNIRDEKGRARLKESWAKQDERNKKKDTTAEVPVEAQAEQLATELYDLLASGQGAMHEREDGSWEIISPGFGSSYGRVFPRSLITALEKFREDDIFEVMLRYTNAAIKRGVWQKNFGLNSEIDEIERRIAEAKGDEKKLKDAIRYREERILYYAENYEGTELYDPAAKLRVDIIEQHRKGKLSRREVDFIMDKIIPAYQGRLGADIHPAWRRLQSLLLVYQNWRVLSMGVFAQFIDLGLVVNRAEGQRAMAMRQALKLMTDSTTREEAQRIAHAIGAVEEGFTDHIMNDEAGVLLVDSRLRRANEALFKYNGMQWLTNASRMWSMLVAREFISTVAKSADTAELERLGLTQEDVARWEAAKRPMEGKEARAHARVVHAVNQFINESVLRPGPDTRPEWGNHQKWAIFWHLKSFPWAFTYTILGAAYERSVERWGQEQGAKKFYAALPFLTLAAITMPLAALGMELRWLVSPPSQRPEGGWEYAMETIKRSGLTGYGQLLGDMDTATEYHRFALLAPLGPTVSQIEELWGKGLDYDLQKALPASGVVRGLEHWWGVAQNSPSP